MDRPPRGDADAARPPGGQALDAADDNAGLPGGHEPAVDDDDDDAVDSGLPGGHADAVDDEARPPGGHDITNADDADADDGDDAGLPGGHERAVADAVDRGPPGGHADDAIDDTDTDAVDATDASAAVESWYAWQSASVAMNEGAHARAWQSASVADAAATSIIAACATLVVLLFSSSQA